MSKLRVLLDENLSRDLGKAFAKKIPVYTVDDFGLSGADDRRVIEEAVYRKCPIVTADSKFRDTYRNHEWRKGRDVRLASGSSTETSCERSGV
jgi:predicted nuclease of predicted toxin-antitoxin system